MIDRTFVRRWAVALILAGLTGLAVMAFFLWIYPAKGFTVPIGWDTSRYLWRTTVAQSVGLAHLEEGVPAYVNADPARLVFPVLAGVLSSLFGPTTSGWPQPSPRWPRRRLPWPPGRWWEPSSGDPPGR